MSVSTDTDTTRRGSLSSKPTMMVSPSPKPRTQQLPDKPDLPLKPTSPKPAVSAKPKLPSKPVFSPSVSPTKPKSPPPPKPPKPMSPTAVISEPLAPAADKIKTEPAPPAAELPVELEVSPQATADPTTDTSPGLDEPPRARAASSGVVLRRKKRTASDSPSGSPSAGRRYSVAAMGENGELSSSHDVRKDAEVRGEEIWKKNTAFHTPGYSLFFPPIPQTANPAHYSSNSAIFRGLDLVPDELVVLQAFQFTHQTFGAFVAYQCDKTGVEVEGGSDFVVLSENQVVILDVQHGSALEGYQESVTKRAKVVKLVRRIIIKTFRFKMPTVKPFTVFPDVSKSAASSSLSEDDMKSCLFSEDISDFTTWWTTQFKTDKAKKDKEFQQAFERVKQTVFGIWAMGRGEGEDYTLPYCLKSLDTSRTLEIELLDEAVSKSKVVHSSAPVYGVRPTLHLVYRREGHEEVKMAALVDEILGREKEVLNGVDSAAVVELTDSEVSPTTGLDCVRSYSDVTSREWTAVVAVADLSAALRLSFLRDGKRVDVEEMVGRIKAAVNKVHAYFSLVLIVSATEVQGDAGFNDFGNETLNKDNRAYFHHTKSAISSLVQTIVPQTNVKFYDTTKNVSLPHRESLSNISKMIDSMYQFPDKRLNREAILSVTQQIAAVESNILGLVSKVNTQKSATKNWGNLGSRNDELRRAKNTIEKLQDELNHMLEMHGRVAEQIVELSKSYDVVLKDVEANMD